LFICCGVIYDLFLSINCNLSSGALISCNSTGIDCNCCILFNFTLLSVNQIFTFDYYQLMNQFSTINQLLIDINQLTMQFIILIILILIASLLILYYSSIILPSIILIVVLINSELILIVYAVPPLVY
jgi:hypothetical protein